MRLFLLLFTLLLSLNIFADVDGSKTQLKPIETLEALLLNAGIINQDYKIVDNQAFDGYLHKVFLKQINQGLPYKINKFVELKKIQIEGRNLLIYNEIDNASIKYIPGFQTDEIQSRLKWEICNDDFGSSRVFRQAEGMKVIHFFGSQQDPELFKFGIFLKQCDDVHL
ncbi:hypothetical protein [Acinetobacter guillouiae]|uniref:Uncharacterized protein n=1 Tax=Acinetobacter guillouiae NIPH 991 TaxID=1217656 RepID=N8Y490_ACIGI|nr:hypothetical protein [Acinetobacter guillouiae]ENV16134.1 hypothetical protein F964_03069 [Acinetobacter guillouiae NIPH 991]